MLRYRTLIQAVLVASIAALALEQSNAASLTAAQIVEKNVAARGGLAAWRTVKSMSITGDMEAGGKKDVQLPFVLKMKRPRKTRLELQFAGQTAVQVYDGSNGWKLRPFLGRNEVEAYSPDELKAAASQSELDGPLIDYAAKGSKLELEGTEKIEGRDTYKLKVTTKDRETQRVWIDAKTFLDARVEGTPRRLDGVMHPVDIAFRDYRSVDGLMIPHVLETTVHNAAKIPGKGLTLQDQTSKIAIEKVTLNPDLDDTLFTKPQPVPKPRMKETRTVGALVR
jgi:outer membrane lipoprotein-sorting protein